MGLGGDSTLQTHRLLKSLQQRLSTQELVAASIATIAERLPGEQKTTAGRRTAMTNRRASILLGLAILAGCVCFLVMDTVARRRLAAPETTALFCPASMYTKPEPNSHQFQDVSLGAITLHLPNTFKPAAGSFIHGGSAWSDGERWVEVRNGHYDFSSLPNSPAQKQESPGSSAPLSNWLGS
jgi:hypothetical protein